MTTLTNYREMLQAHHDLQEAADLADREMRKFVYKRLNRLRSVGRSVLEKSLGHRRFSELTPGMLGNEFNWMLRWGFYVGEVSPENFVLRESIFSSVKEHDPQFIVPVSLLSVSDREFAKQVRASLRSAESRTSEALLHNVEVAREALRAAEVEYLMSQVAEMP